MIIDKQDTDAQEGGTEQDGNPAYVWEKIQREKREALTNRTE